MTQQNGGAPADGGGAPQDTGAEQGATGAAGKGAAQDDGGDGAAAREPLSAEELESRYGNVREALRRERVERRAEREELERLRQERSAPKPRAAKTAEAEDDDDEDIEIPDVDEDPRAAVIAMRKLMSRYRDQQKKQAETAEQTEHQAREIKSTMEYMAAAERDYREDVPDYTDAIKHLKTSMREDLEVEGLNEAAIKAEINKELLRLVRNARNNKADPADILYKRAIKRYGYKSKKADADLDAVERGQRSSADVPRGGGKRSGVTTKAVLEAEGKDFEKVWAEYEKKAMSAS